MTAGREVANPRTPPIELMTLAQIVLLFIVYWLEFPPPRCNSKVLCFFRRRQDLCRFPSAPSGTGATPSFRTPKYGGAVEPKVTTAPSVPQIARENPARGSLALELYSFLGGWDCECASIFVRAAGMLIHPPRWIIFADGLFVIRLRKPFPNQQAPTQAVRSSLFVQEKYLGSAVRQTPRPSRPTE